MIKVFFFGDSICNGQGISIHKGWVTRIAAELSNLTETYHKEIVLSNASINGNTTRLALERMPYDIQSHKPDIVIIQFGMNDCNCWQTDLGEHRVSPKAFKANIEEIINRCYTFGAKFIFLNTNHPTARDTENLPYRDISYQESNSLYNSLIRETANNNKVILNDIEKIFEERTKNNKNLLKNLLLPDFLHLSEEGHKIYFENIYPGIKKALLSLLSESNDPPNNLVL